MTGLDAGASKSELAEEIRSRGYWHVVMRPAEYNAQLLDYRDLFSIMESASVLARGWAVPHIDVGQPPEHGATWVGGSTDWQHHRELWQLHLSGQFVHLNGLWNDWRDRSSFSPPRDGWAAGRELDVTDTLWSIGEYFTLASRLVLALPDTATFVVRLRLHGLQGRVLTINDRRRAPFIVPRTTAMSAFDTGTTEYSADQLVADHREYAVATAIELFSRFGWNPEPGVLRDNLDELWTLR